MYETDTLTRTEARRFEAWLDKNIGTEVQNNDHGYGEFTLTIFDLEEAGEVEQVRAYENAKGYTNEKL